MVRLSINCLTELIALALFLSNVWCQTPAGIAMGAVMAAIAIAF